VKPQLLAVAAGVPPEIADSFVTKSLSTAFPIIASLALDWTQRYTKTYSNRLYGKLAAKLKQLETEGPVNTLDRSNLLLFYMDKNDDSEAPLFECFGIESLMIPLSPPSTFTSGLLATKNQREQAANHLIRQGRRAIRRVESVLAVIAEEVTSRDSKTCLLLPPKNFGRDIGKVLDCVHSTCLDRQEGEEFKRRLARAFRSLKKVREGGHTYVVGKGGLVFRSPGKAAARHALSPAWATNDHDPSCVIRGRMRFGAPYDRKFHYDCDLGPRVDRNFPSCHGFKLVPRDRNHVNISPNDNVR